MPVLLYRQFPEKHLKPAMKGIKLNQGQGQNNAGVLTLHSRKTKTETFQFYYRTNLVKTWHKLSRAVLWEPTSSRLCKPEFSTREPLIQGYQPGKPS